MLPTFLVAALIQAGPNQWSDPGLPLAAGWGGGVVATDADTLYLVAGGGQDFFSRYTISTGVWTSLAAVPAPVTWGGTVAFMPGTTHLYVTPGYDPTRYPTAAFYRYDIVDGQWAPMADLPENDYYGTALAAAGGKVYAFGGAPEWFGSRYGGGLGFYEFRPDGDVGAWVRMADAPASAGDGSALAAAGPGAFLYALRGAGTFDVWRYDIAGNSWISSASDPSIEPLPVRGGLGSAMTAGPGGSIYAFPGNDSHYNGPTSTAFLRFDIDAGGGGRWTPLATLPQFTGGGAALAWPGGDVLHGIPGGSTTDLWRYSIAGDSFLRGMPPVPASVGPGGAMVGAGGELYAFRGLDTTTFYRYSPVNGAWTELAPAPAPVTGSLGSGSAAPGASLCSDGGDSVFARRGGWTKDVWHYSRSGDSWTTLPSLPEIGDGGLVCAGAFLYATVAADDIAIYGFYRLSITNPSPGWEILQKAPVYVGATSGLVYPASGDRIYLLGGYASEFGSYSISSDTWTLLAPFPEDIFNNYYGAQISMMHPAWGRSIYGLIGGRLWSYSTTADAWTFKSAPPGTVSAGLAIAYPGSGGYAYVLAGGGTDTFWRYWIDSAAPTLSSPAQFRRDGITAIPAGGPTAESGFVVQVAAADLDDDYVKVEVELRPAGAAFSDSATSTGSLAAGGVLSVTVEPLLPGLGYHWQARVVDARDAASAWVSFGTHPDLASETDLSAANRVPSAASGLQFRASRHEGVSVGALVYGETALRFESSLADPDGDIVRLQVELRPVGLPFSGVPTITGDSAGATVPIGAGRYHWRYRAVDSHDDVGPWISFGGNAESEPDFELRDLGGSEAAHACLLSAPAWPTPPWLLLLALAGVRFRRAFH